MQPTDPIVIALAPELMSLLRGFFYLAATAILVDAWRIVWPKK